MNIDVSMLDEVEVRAERTQVEIRLDKKIYNVGQDITVKILSGILLCSNDIVAYSSGSEVSESVTIPETLKIILAKFARCSAVYSCENVYEVKVNKKNK